MAGTNLNLGNTAQTYSYIQPASFMVGTIECASGVYPGQAVYQMPNGRVAPVDKKAQSKARKKELKKKLKAEAKACDLMTSLVGKEQGAIYKKTYRAITMPGKYFWIVGDVFNNRYTGDPFFGHPEVVRIDDSKKLYYTKFCVVQFEHIPTPYTDKVISFLTNLCLDEKKFYKTINRIGEGRFNTIAECAKWELE